MLCLCECVLRGAKVCSTEHRRQSNHSNDVYTIGRRIDYNIWYIKYICYPWAKLQFLVLSRFRELLGKRSRGRCRCRAVAVCSTKFHHLCSSLFLQPQNDLRIHRIIFRFLVFFTMYKWIAYVVRIKNTYTHTHTNSLTKLHSQIGQIRAIRGEYELVRFVALGLR